MLGNANHLSNTRVLTHGVAADTAATPSAVNHKVPRAHCTARSCSAPSVFMISHVAPSSRYPAINPAAVQIAKTTLAASYRKPVIYRPSIRPCEAVAMTDPA